jgi:hypothetical protein
MGDVKTKSRMEASCSGEDDAPAAAAVLIFSFSAETVPNQVQVWRLFLALFLLAVR